MATQARAQDDALLAQVSRPHKRLLYKYLIPIFVVVAIAAIGLPVAMSFGYTLGQVLLAGGLGGAMVVGFMLLGMVIPLVRYFTLQYEIEDRGIRMSEGLINRRENYLTFARIQDIHLDRDLIDRWMGIGTISVQTASGQSSAEAKLYGLPNSLEVRDALYRRLRRVQGLVAGEADEDDEGEEGSAEASEGAAAVASAGGSEELTELLRGIAEETGRLRLAVEALAAERGTAAPSSEGAAQ